MKKNDAPNLFRTGEANDWLPIRIPSGNVYPGAGRGQGVIPVPIGRDRPGSPPAAVAPKGRDLHVTERNPGCTKVFNGPAKPQEKYPISNVQYPMSKFPLSLALPLAGGRGRVVRRPRQEDGTIREWPRANEAQERRSPDRHRLRPRAEHPRLKEVGRLAPQSLIRGQDAPAPLGRPPLPNCH